MATNYTVDTKRFYADGAIIDWIRSVRLLGVQADPGRLRPVTQLRWMLHPNMGMPSEPFKVWARRRSSQSIQQALGIKSTTLLFMGAYTAITWPNGRMAHVSIDVSSSISGTIFAFAGGPQFSNINAWVAVSNGNSTVEIGAPVIDGLLVPPGISVSAVRGISTASLSQAAGWELIETVGLPTRNPAWIGIGRHGERQGMVSAPIDADAAAIQRLERGAPPIGWGSLLAPGIPAPGWTAPAFDPLLDEINKELLDYLRGSVASIAPNLLAAHKITMPMAPPQNSVGQSVDATSSDAQVSPLAMTLIAAGSDPFLSLALGFGTAYPFTQENPTFVGAPRMDYMITAHWDKGLDGNSPPADFAALVPAPALATAPPTPANIAAQTAGILKPAERDGAWRGTSRVSWDRMPKLNLFRAPSFAAARAGLVPAEPARAMMAVRPSGGYRPLVISATDREKDPAWFRIHAIDRELPIPTNPGSRSVKYAVAVQDIYGQWTRWLPVDQNLKQPELDLVRISTAKLTPVPAGASTVCPATLEMEFLWDWSVRSPSQIEFAGLLYTTTDHGGPPPSLAIPSALPRSIGGLDPRLTITFAGDTPTAPGATIIGLDPSGENQVGFGASQGSEGRRYRVTMPGFALDFSLAGHIGLALWARAQERIAPQRTGGWSPSPVVTTASDPRPPIFPVEFVQLGSLPDAAGQSHARIAWAAQAGVAGYFIYESDETQILAALGFAEPTPEKTLADRLKVIKDNFSSIPRRVFTRLNATAVEANSLDIAMPKGSTVIHFYMVLGISAGQVESDWPTDKDKLIALAAPHIKVPSPPMLEVARFLDAAVTPPAYRTRITVTTRPGPHVKKIELHRVRVDDAAKDLDSMGPPIAKVATTSGDWVVTNATNSAGASFIDTAVGIDTPTGSWRRVWYRATAWSERDDARGGLPGRSLPSTTAWVVIPPAASPALSPVTVSAGSLPTDVVFEWTSTAPVKRTPLGPHVLSVSASVSGAGMGALALLRADSPTDKLPVSMPAATESGAWIAGSAAETTTYRAIVRRAKVSDPIRFAARITDPLGRTGEALREVPAGPVIPAPTITEVLVHRLTFPPPKRLVLQFSSVVPLMPTGSYRVSVAITPTGPAMPPPTPTVVDMETGSVPTLTSPFSGMGLFRLPGSGPKITFLLQAPQNTSSFAIRITAPDGQFAEVTQPVV